MSLMISVLFCVCLYTSKCIQAVQPPAGLAQLCTGHC
jgi:hypothetical protein